jgi:hypothetical protein
MVDDYIQNKKNRELTKIGGWEIGGFKGKGVESKFWLDTF